MSYFLKGLKWVLIAWLYQYLAMLFFCWFEKLSFNEATPLAFLSYLSAYSGEPIVRQALIKAAIMPAFVAGAAWLAKEMLAVRRGVFGAARWATKQEMLKAGFFSEDGLHLGKVGDKYVRMNEFLHTMIQAQTGTMKSAALIIPNLFRWRGSAFVLDPKGELYKFTSWFRKTIFRNSIAVIDPFDERLRSNCFNRMDSVRVGHPACVSDLDVIATEIWPQGNGDSEEWANMARGMFKALALYLIESKKERLTLPAIFRASLGYGEGFIPYYSKVLKDHGQQMTGTTREALSALVSQGEGGKSNTFSSIKSVFNNSMEFFNNPLMEAVFDHSDFNFGEIRKRRMTVYFCASTANKRASGVIGRLLIGALKTQNDTQLNSTPEIKHRVLLLLDEMALLGRSGDIEDILQLGRSRGLLVFGIFQTLGQVVEGWGNEGVRILLGGMKIKMFFGCAEMKDATEWCEYLGERTEKNQGTGTSTSQDGSSNSTNTTQVQSQLVYPAELLYRDSRKAIVLVRGVRPAEIDLAPWFEIPDMWRRFEGVIKGLAEVKKCPPQTKWEDWANSFRLSVDLPPLKILSNRVPKPWTELEQQPDPGRAADEKVSLVNLYRERIREALRTRVQIRTPDGEIIGLLAS